MSKKSKLPKKWYTVKREFVTSKKVYKPGNKIRLTEEGRQYLEQINII